MKRKLKACSRVVSKKVRNYENRAPPPPVPPIVNWTTVHWTRGSLLPSSRPFASLTTRMSSLRNQLVSITRRLSSFVVGTVARDAIEHRGRAIYLEVIALSSLPERGREGAGGRRVQRPCGRNADNDQPVVMRFTWHTSINGDVFARRSRRCL